MNVQHEASVGLPSKNISGTNRTGGRVDPSAVLGRSGEEISLLPLPGIPTPDRQGSSLVTILIKLIDFVDFLSRLMC